jgi:hypothetical protein
VLHHVNLSLHHTAGRQSWHLAPQDICRPRGLVELRIYVPRCPLQASASFILCSFTHGPRALGYCINSTPGVDFVHGEIVSFRVQYRFRYTKHAAEAEIVTVAIRWILFLVLDAIEKIRHLHRRSALG